MSGENMNSGGEKHHISVCICTYKRPAMLARAIEKTLLQETGGKISCELVIVDNDLKRSAENLVKEYRERSSLTIIYDCEPKQNISLARNRAIHNSTGNLIAFIDDDEFPEPDWLYNLHKTLTDLDADGVLGPVIPDYEGDPPGWLIKSGLCDRESFPTGTELKDSKHMRTGNVLINRRILEDTKNPFNPKHGLTGGEDAHFFEDMVAKGHSFVWCNEAVVKEEVPRDRQKLKYFMMRAFVRGVTSADQQPVMSSGTLKSLIAVFLYTVGLPFFLLRGYHHFARYLVKTCDHVAKLLAHCGIKLAKIRNF